MPKVPNKPPEKERAKAEPTKVGENALENSTDDTNQNVHPPAQSSSWNRFRKTKIVRKYGWIGLVAAIITILAGLAYFLAYFGVIPEKFYSSTTQPSPTPVQHLYTVLVPLAATGSETNAFLDKKDGSTYEAPYSNKASQNIRDIVEVAKKQWIENNAGKKLKIDDIEFFCFPEGYDEDKDSFEKAFNHAMTIAKEKNRKVIGLLGNVSSTSTLKYGEFCSKEKLPMILPLATATNLIQALKLKGVPAVLRLPPANDKQAVKISEFLLEKQIYDTVIIRDLTNETYSSDLVESFRENYVQKPLSIKSKSGEILGTISIGGKETSPFLYSTLSSNKNGLVIVGMTNSAIETLAQVKASNSKYKLIILTDGAVDEYLGERIKKVLSGEALTDIYIAFPTPCVISKSIEGYIQLKTIKSAEQFI